MTWLVGQSILRGRAAGPDLHREFKALKMGWTALRQEDRLEVRIPGPPKRVSSNPTADQRGEERREGEPRDGGWLFHTLFLAPREHQGPKFPVSHSPPAAFRHPPEEQTCMYTRTSSVPSRKSRPRQSPTDPTASFPSPNHPCLGQIPASGGPATNPGWKRK